MNAVEARRKARANKKARNAEAARTAHEDAANRIDDLLAEIKEGLDAHRNTPNPHWGHVGDLTHKVNQLQDIADSLNGRGEYAD